MNYKWVPNILTSTRILLVPVFIYFLFADFSHGKLFALFIFLIAAITDACDGMIARKHNVVSKFGIFFDPLADKFLVLSAFYAFMFLPILSTTVKLWMLILISFRDILITKEQKKEIDDVMKKGEKIDLIEIDKLVYKYRGSYYLEMAFKNSSFMKESGLDFSENFEETRLEALSKELNRFVGLKTQEKTIPEEETFINLVEDTFGYKDKEEKKIA